MPVYDKPMIYYPLSTLILAGVQDVLIITTPRDRPTFEHVLGDGSQFGIRLSYCAQPSPDGLAQALVLGETFLAGRPSAVVLGDNLLHGPGLGTSMHSYETASGATIFGCWVRDPTPYGVVEVSADGRALSIEEKPLQPRSHLAVPGLYFYDGTASERARSLSPSSRGELEITDLHRSYMTDDALRVQVMPRGTVWLDTGTVGDLAAAGEFVRTVQQRQGLAVGAPEEAAWRVGLLDDGELASRAERLTGSEYGRYLRDLVDQETSTHRAGA